jgi:hypothetical protein
MLIDMAASFVWQSEIDWVISVNDLLCLFNLHSSTALPQDYLTRVCLQPQHMQMGVYITLSYADIFSESNG